MASMSPKSSSGGSSSSRPDDKTGQSIAAIPTATTVDVLRALRLVVELGWVERVVALQSTSLECLVSCRDATQFRLKVGRKTPRRVWYPKLCKRGSCEASVGGSAPPLLQMNR